MNSKRIFFINLFVASIFVSGCAPSAELAVTPDPQSSSATTSASLLPPNPQNEPITDLTGKPYTDPDGYFKITPPIGWNIEEYLSDPRGKVAFGYMDGDQLVGINVFVQETQVTDFQVFEQKLKSNAEKLGLQPEWELISFLGLPAIRSTMIFSGGGLTRKIMNLRFLDGNIYHDIQFSSSPALYDKYQDVVSKVVASYKIIKQ